MLQNEFKEDAPTEDLPTSNDAETESNRQKMGHEGNESEEWISQAVV